MAELTATMYGVPVARYYDEDANKAFCDFGMVVDDLQDWIGKQATVGETCTYEPSEDNASLRTFCLDMRRLKVLNAVLFATWNEVSGTEEGVQVISATAKVGAAEVSTTELDPLSVPGYPSFFVFLPDARQILNLRFSANRLNGSQGMKHFVRGFMQEAARWAVRKGEVCAGYALDGKNVEGAYLPQFETNLLRRPTSLDWLRTHAGDIRKIVHRKLIKPVVEEHRDFLDRTFIMLGLKPNKRLRADIDFEYEFKIKIGPEKLDQIIASYETRDDDDEWTDVGFILAGNASKRYWLSGALCREKLDLDVINAAADMVDIDSLVEVLNARLEEIIRRVQ